MGVALRKDSRALEHASYAGLSEKWVSACDLKHGDKVLLSDGTLCEVEGVTLKQLETPETTYNLEVADFHTYYVSDACVLVHNADCGATQGNPLEDIRYTDKVKAQMRIGDYHSFPAQVDNYGALGKQLSIVGKDGVKYTKLQIKGAYQGHEGVFEYIYNSVTKICNHRIFRRL